MGKLTTDLPERLLASLARGLPALLLTVDADGFPNAIFTWTVALDAARIRFGVDDGSTAMHDLERADRAAIQFIGPGNATYVVKGRARRVRDRVAAAAPAPIMLYEMRVDAAKDQSWPGVEIAPLRYEWPAEQREALLCMELEVYAEMRA